MFMRAIASRWAAEDRTISIWGCDNDYPGGTRTQPPIRPGLGRARQLIITAMTTAPTIEYGSDPAICPGSLGEREAHVWIVALDPAAGDEDVLSAAERAAMCRISLPAARLRYARSHAAARQIVAAYLRCDPRGIVLRPDARGKPLIADANLHFSLAHAGDVALVGIGRGGPLGVDVELVRPLPEREALVRRCFTARERADLLACDGDEETLRLWVRKEAVAKTTGYGLARVFDGLDVLSDDAVPGWRIVDLAPAPRHVGALAVRDDVSRLVVTEFDASGRLRHPAGAGQTLTAQPPSHSVRPGPHDR